MKLRLRERLFLSHSGLAILAVLLTFLGAYYVARSSIIERAFQQLESVKTLKRLKILAWCNDVRKRSALIPAILEAQTFKNHRTLESALERTDLWPETLGVWVLDQDLKTVQSFFDPNEIPAIPAKVSETPWFFEGRAALWILVPMKSSAKHDRAYLLLKLSYRKLGQFLSERAGLGLSGESYLVGSDHLMRTESRFVGASGSAKLLVDTQAVKHALQNGRGREITRDYRHLSVLSAYDNIKIDGVEWAILSEIDEAEVLAPLDRMLKVFFIVSAFVVAIVLVLSKSSAKLLATPIEQEESLHRIRVNAFLEGQERERRRIAQELHDGVGQLLTVASLKIATSQLETKLSSSVRGSIEDVLSEVRRISHGLMPSVLARLGLAAALRELCLQSARASGIRVDFQVDADIENLNLSEPTQIHLYRVAQECIKNTLSHANATRCLLRYSRDQDSLVLEIVDDGQWVPYDTSRTGGLGIVSVRERVDALGGRLDMKAKSNAGETVVRVSVPLVLEDSK